MSRIVTLLCFFCTFLCARVCAIGIPANPPLVWSKNGVAATVLCGLASSRYWWSGTDVNDYNSFERIGNGNQVCSDESRFCELPFTHFDKDPHTYICCTENGPLNINNAQEIDCYEIAVCPDDAQISPPLIVEAENTETVHMRVITKPPPIVEPESLLQISIEGGPVINTTSAVAIQGEVKSSKALETVYKFQFQVPQELLLEGTTTTLKFVPLFLQLQYGDSCLTTFNARSVTNIRVTPRAPVTTDPRTSSSSTQATTEQSVTEGFANEQCVHVGVPVGASVLTLVIGIGLGLVTCWFIWCYNSKRRQEVMKPSDQYNGSFSFHNDSLKRKLPNPPIPSTLGTQPLMRLQLSPHSFPGPTGDIPSMPTPTPDDSSRLLAGQTPVGLSSMDKHPLNHNAHHDPIPYATTDQMRSLSQSYTPPSTTTTTATETLTMTYRGGPYPSPVGNQTPTNMLPNDPAGLTIYAKEGDFMQLHMDNNNTLTESLHYVKEGENIKLPDPQELDCPVAIV